MDSPTISLQIKNSRKIKDYSEILKENFIEYEIIGDYLQVGKLTLTQGWIIDISVIIIQLPELLKIILPLLMEQAITFKIAATHEKATSILSGDFGYISLGKVISIFPVHDQQALEIAIKLISLTDRFKGPEILTDRQLGSVVYARYGAHNPIIIPSENGIDQNHIYNNNGELIKESFTIPFTLPAKIEWPFTSIVSPRPPKKETVLQDKYKPMYVLKMDVKGSVRKGLYLEKIYRIKWCVIKEGKRHMASDSKGQVMADRLHWQFELQNDLGAILPLPRIYDLFDENGDTYLVMQYLKGKELDKLIVSLFENRIWSQLSTAEKLKLLDYSIKILSLIQTMHTLGYIHRDITPANFLIDKMGQPWMIDLELCYSEKLKKPKTPFSLGTPGFMSPEQENSEWPTMMQDIYALGGLLITLLTSLLPNSFARIGEDLLREQLSFFIPDARLVNVLIACLNPNPNKRPDLGQVKKHIEEFRQKVISVADPIVTNPSKTSLDREYLMSQVNHALEGLASPALLAKNQLWLTKMNGEDLSYSQDRSVAVQYGFSSGLSGILYMLSKASKAGFNIKSCMEAYTNSWSVIRQNDKVYSNRMPAGLYFGSAGIAIALAAGIDSGLIANEKTTTDQMKEYLENSGTNGLSMVKGLAGQGMALLRASSLLENNFVQPLLNEKIGKILELQQKDGSWVTITDNNKKELKVTGFAYGVAGITCFLLEYCKKHKGADLVQRAADKALEWLMQMAGTKDGLWPLNNTTRDRSSGFQDGWAGIILTLIRGYEAYGTIRYRVMAELALRKYPHYGVVRNITIDSGLTGYGEVCLEAARLFRSEEWLDRSNWISNFLLHRFEQQDDGSCFWLTDSTPFPKAGLMDGNSGVIHFLIRSCSANQFNHPMVKINI